MVNLIKIGAEVAKARPRGLVYPNRLAADCFRPWSIAHSGVYSVVGMTGDFLIILLQDGGQRLSTVEC